MVIDIAIVYINDTTNVDLLFATIFLHFHYWITCNHPVLSCTIFVWIEESFIGHYNLKFVFNIVSNLLLKIFNLNLLSDTRVHFWCSYSLVQLSKAYIFILINLSESFQWYSTAVFWVKLHQPVFKIQSNLLSKSNLWCSPFDLWVSYVCWRISQPTWSPLCRFYGFVSSLSIEFNHSSYCTCCSTKLLSNFRNRCFLRKHP